ncbi:MULTISPECIES: RNA polymerase sigma-I factor [Psychrobacillus]|uniref:RNA polymerase sigma factor SigI n=1 Tax=Psychrobacillus faecigallinarum TaxID=2762235 RepID=A0ABR8R689_9BACI|nr:RNA polymerase sigma-I factor [Psychrobacillus faecigallinarum]MBD7943306.1 RNA polymerase sigma-I factor [Psychrobacillus faecigallinarum]
MLLSIIQGLFKTKQNKRKLGSGTIAGEEEAINDLLLANTSFIKKTAAYICKRPIDEQDEEYSIALNGFHEAVLAYNPKENASLQTLAHLIIKRRLVDFIRKEAARKEKVLLLHTGASDESVDEQHFIWNEQSIESYTEEQLTEARREELIRYGELLAEYNLSFNELTVAAPKHKDARKTAFLVAQIISESEELYQSFIKHKRLPLKDIEALVDVSRKTLERHRKYMIAVILLLNSDFVYIKDYVKGEII